MDIQKLKEKALCMRRDILEMVYHAQSGHPGGSLSAADIVAYLYFEEMNINKENCRGTNRDRFVLSKGHASPVLYAALNQKGLIDVDLSTFRKLDSILQGHPCMSKLAGVDMSTGSLGQGISTSVGMAIANKLDQNDHRVYTLMGDGESQEGIVYEALMSASHYKLDNLCVILDFNHLQIDGEIEKVLNPTPFKEKFEAFGFKVFSIDGHDFNQIGDAFKKARETKGQPSVIIAHTIKGKGVSFMENDYTWHGVAPNTEQYEKALAELQEVK